MFEARIKLAKTESTSLNWLNPSAKNFGQIDLKIDTDFFFLSEINNAMYP